MAEHQWAPPEHPDVTLHQPVDFSPELAGALTPIDPRQPVWADIRFVSIPDVLHLKCFAVASSEVAVLVQTSWQGRLQKVLVDRTTSPGVYLTPQHDDLLRLLEHLERPSQQVAGAKGSAGCGGSMTTLNHRCWCDCMTAQQSRSVLKRYYHDAMRLANGVGSPEGA
jgi:hypothetical protein